MLYLACQAASTQMEQINPIFPGVDGMVYWNENRPSFTSDINALNPYFEPGSELEEDYSLIGWSQDIDGNDSLYIIWDNVIGYNTGLSSHPQMVIDDQNRIFLVYSSVTENFYYGTPPESNFRHIWIRSSPDWRNLLGYIL